MMVMRKVERQRPEMEVEKDVFRPQSGMNARFGADYDANPQKRARETDCNTADSWVEDQTTLSPQHLKASFSIVHKPIERKNKPFSLRFLEAAHICDTSVVLWLKVVVLPFDEDAAIGGRRMNRRWQRLRCPITESKRLLLLPIKKANG
jgi:hypothetical protein